MNEPSRHPSETKARERDSARDSSKQRDTNANELQPAASGADSGSPAAPVMKQFAKTEAESTGQPDESRKSPT